MNRKRLQGSAFLALFWIAVLAVTLTTATYAWFTISAITNVEPMEGGVSRGDGNLLISSSRQGPFEKECRLQLSGNVQELMPLSTADLEHFYEASGQNAAGIVKLYRDATAQAEERALHGTVYLRSEYGACDVYLKRSGLDFGTDGQVLAAARLGLRITAQNGNSTRIFRLDELGNTGSAVSKLTVPDGGTVVSAVNGAGSASFVRDPSVAIGDYLAVENGADDQEPEAGRQMLCTIQADEIVSVEFWLYLEGCDEQCINEVQERSTGIQLAFAGVPLSNGGNEA